MMPKNNNQNASFNPRFLSQTKAYLIEVILGFLFAFLIGLSYFGAGSELEFIYQGF